MENVRNIVTEALGKIKERGGLKAVYFVACGGSQAAIYPGKYLLDVEARNIPTKIYNSNEFVYATPASLDERCLVICCSLKATAETVEAVKKANEIGAVTIAMTGNMETGMAKVGQYVVTYSNGNDQVYSLGNQAQVLRICFEILHQAEGYPYYDEAMAAYSQIDDIIATAKRDWLPRAEKFANDYKDDTMFYILGAGPLWGTAYSMVNCHLIEMQQRNACLIHSGEYFHGPFETTGKGVAIVLLMSTGRTRFLDERVVRFLDKYADHATIIDAADLDLENRLGKHVAEFFNSVVMIPMERYFVSTMADVRGRSMDDRTYMWKVEY